MKKIFKILISVTAAVLLIIPFANVFFQPHNNDHIGADENAVSNPGLWYGGGEKVIYSYLDEKAAEEETAQYIDPRDIEPPPAQEGLADLKDMLTFEITRHSGEWGIYIKNLSSNEYLSINERDYSSASLIKLFTMAAVCNECEAGKLPYDEEISENLAKMICESDNRACNYLTKQVGQGDTVSGFKTENTVAESYGCGNTNHGSELVDGSKRRVTFTGFNKTSPRDCGIILENVYRRTLVSPEWSDRMLDLLLAQERRWKIPAPLPEGTVTANKTGETDNVQGDAAIVFSPGCDYVICVIGNGSVGKGGVGFIQDISSLAYNYFNPPADIADAQ